MGDNLGLNGILGFVESFKSHYICRICKATSEETWDLVAEDESKLRTKINYITGVKQADAAKTGIKEECVFHKVNGFQLTENVTVDMMHDVLEGVCMYVMTSLIYTFVFEKHYFTLEDLNTRITDFEYDSIEKSNKPPAITMNRILQKVLLKMFAAEMLCLVRYFGLIIGDLIPKDDIHWELYLYLRQILDFYYHHG